MRWIVGILIGLHGLIHLLGVAKALDPQALPTLPLTISRGMGWWWLIAGVLLVATALMSMLRLPGWWLLGAAGLVVSQVLIVGAWSEAWAGTIGNVFVLCAVLLGWFLYGPTSLRHAFDQDVAPRFDQSNTATIEETDLAGLPAPARRFLAASGVIGQPRVRNYRIRFRGRIRGTPEARWMPFTVDQQSFADAPSRFFLMHARMFGLPVEAFHRLAEGQATMQVKLLGAIPLVRADGAEMNRAESVTLLNDMVVMAPATLLDPTVRWEAIDDRTTLVRFTHGPDTVSATLLIDPDGRLIDFISDDRPRLSEDGKRFESARFSTPILSYGTFGSMRLPRRAEARWSLPAGGDFAYAEVEMISVEYNVRP
ncbi:MAG: DUF6544 family protein [Gemmatimonadales bacterium]